MWSNALSTLLLHSHSSEQLLEPLNAPMCPNAFISIYLSGFSTDVIIFHPWTGQFKQNDNCCLKQKIWSNLDGYANLLSVSSFISHPIILSVIQSFCQWINQLVDNSINKSVKPSVPQSSSKRLQAFGLVSHALRYILSVSLIPSMSPCSFLTVDSRY